MINQSFETGNLENIKSMHRIEIITDQFRYLSIVAKLSKRSYIRIPTIWNNSIIFLCTKLDTEENLQIKMI